MEKERELVPVPVKHQTKKEELKYIDDLPAETDVKPSEMPRRWYAY